MSRGERFEIRAPELSRSHLRELTEAHQPNFIKETHIREFAALVNYALRPTNNRRYFFNFERKTQDYPTHERVSLRVDPNILEHSQSRLTHRHEVNVWQRGAIKITKHEGIVVDTIHGEMEKPYTQWTLSGVLGNDFRQFRRFRYAGWLLAGKEDSMCRISDEPDYNKLFEHIVSGSMGGTIADLNSEFYETGSYASKRLPRGTPRDYRELYTLVGEHLINVGKND